MNMDNFTRSLNKRITEVRAAANEKLRLDNDPTLSGETPAQWELRVRLNAAKSIKHRAEGKNCRKG